MTEPNAPQTHIVGEGADAITYDVRGDLAAATAERPALFMLGSPMDASGFGTLAGYFTDRPLISYDPRGAGRNPSDTTDVTPEQHAADIHRVIEAVDAGPVDVLPRAGVPSTSSPWWRRTRKTCAGWSPTSRRRPCCCPTAKRRWRPVWTTKPPTCGRVPARRWRCSSPWSWSRASRPPTTPSSRRRTPRCLASRARTTAPAPTR